MAASFRYCGSVGPLSPTPSESAEWSAIGATLAKRFDLVGLFGVNAIVNADGIWPVEVNPRYTASIEILERAYGIASIALHVAACESGELPSEGLRNCERRWGKAIVFARQRLEFDAGGLAIDSPQNDAGGICAPWPSCADIPASGAIIEAGWPILTVMAEGADDRTVIEALKRRTADLYRAIER